MDKVDELFYNITNRFDYKTELIDPAEDILAEFSSILDICRSEIAKYKKSNGTYKFNSDVYDIKKVKKDVRKDSFKENIDVADESQLESPKRSKRNAAKNAEKHLKQGNLRDKLRCPTNITMGDYQNVYVKLEKLSISPKKSILSSHSENVDKSTIKVEKDKIEMPAPTIIPPKKKAAAAPKKSLRLKKKDSDVIIQEKEIVTIDITEKEQENRPQRVTRSKVVKKNSVDSDRSTRSTVSKETSGKPKKKPEKKKESIKRDRSDLSEDLVEEAKNKKRSKSDCNETKYDDAVSTVEPDEKNEEKLQSKPATPKMDATFLTTSPINKNLAQNMNATVVIENLKCVSPKEKMTDNESDKEIAPPPRNASRIPKQVFSPYDHSPVKKKVEAYEKIAAAANLPQRTTRTKTKTKEQQNQPEKEPSPKEEKTQKAALGKNNYYTPNPPKFAPKICSTAIKSQSASKILDGVKKRDALLQAQSEEKKRKREEKEMKVKQRAEALEKEKQKNLEQQRLKEERYKKIVAEQEEKRLKLKEKLERKRLLAKQKALEEQQKKEEMERKLAEQKKKEEEEREREKEKERLKQQEKEKEELRKQKEKMKKLKKIEPRTLPIYMKTPAPLLPTYDCYDSDEEDREPVPFRKPGWANDFYLRRMQNCIDKAGHKIKNTFFSREVQTIDLKEIFETNDPRVLKRTSSANWSRPPKYSVLPALCEEGFLTSDED